MVKAPFPRPSNAVVLGTALVHMRDISDSVQTMMALVDSASQVSIITAARVKLLELKPSPWTAPISGLSGTTVAEVQGR